MSENNPQENKSSSHTQPNFFYEKNGANTVIFAPTQTGMSGHYEKLRLSDEEFEAITSAM